MRRKHLTPAERAARLARVSATTDYSGMGNAPLIIEAVAESGVLKPGVENIVYVLVSTPDGRPAPSTPRTTPVALPPSDRLPVPRTHGATIPTDDDGDYVIHAVSEGTYRVIAGDELSQCGLRGLLVDGILHVEVEPALLG